MQYKDFPWKEIIKWVKFWENKNNKYPVLALHYSSDPDKDPERQWREWYNMQKRKISIQAKWDREMEIEFKEAWSRLIFWPQYCDFDPSIHLIPSFSISWAEMALSLDFWQSNPNCWLIAAYKDWILYIIDEYYKPAIPSAASKDMRIFFRNYIWNTDNMSMDEVRYTVDRAFQVKVIDPSTKNKNRTKDTESWEIPYSVIQEFYDNWFDFMPWNNDVDASITRIRELFKIQKDWKSRLYIFIDKCPNLVRQIQKYRYKNQTERQAITNDNPEKVVKKDDHAVDALRYLVMCYLHEPPTPKDKMTPIQKDIQRLLKPSIITDMDL